MITAAVALAIALKASVILCSGVLLCLALRKSSAALRHLVWSVVLTALLLLPVLEVTTPAWRVALLRPIEVETPTRILSGSTRFDPTRPDGSAPSLSPRVSSSTSAAAPLNHKPDGVSQLELTSSRWFMIAWLAGAAAVLAWVATGMVAVVLLARRAKPVRDARLSAMLEACADELGMHRRVRLLHSAEAVTPMTFGLLRSVIVLPSDAVRWSGDRQRCVLLHELAHIGRRDVLLQQIAQLSCALYWFHPLVWFAARQLRREREHACDNAVVMAGARPSDYATHLLDVARGYRSTPLMQPAALAMARQSQLEGRLLALLKADCDRTRPTRARIAFSLAAALAMIAPLAAFTPVTREVLVQQSAQVIRHPEPSAPLSARFDWAFAQARQSVRRDYWVAYSIRRETFGGDAYISGSGGFELNQLSRTPLQTQLFGTRPPSVRDGQRVERDIAIMFRFPRGADQLDDATAIRLHSMHVGMELENAPVLWLGPANDEQSIEWLRAQFERTAIDWMRDELVEAVGLHESAELAVPFLERVARGNPQSSVRAQAAEALGEQNSPLAVSILRSVVANDSSSDVRREAAEALGQSRAEDATAVLLDLAMTSPDPSVRLEATEALGDQGTRAAGEALLSLVFNGGIDVQREAAEALGDIEGNFAFDVLKRVLETHPNWQIRAEAAETLGDKPAALAIPVLERVIFDDRDVRVQEEAVEALGDLGRSALELVRRVIRIHPDSEVREKAIEVLRDLQNDADKDQELDLNPSTNRESSSNASEESSSEDSEYLPVSIDESKLISPGAAERAPDAHAILPLLENLKYEKQHEMDFVRERSAWALSLVRNGEVVRPLVEALQDKDWRVRAYAAWALASAGDLRAMNALLASAHDTHWRVRMHAIVALGELPAEDSRPANVMIAALNDREWQVRAAAAEALGNSDDQRASDALQRVARDSHIAVRNAAQQSRGRIASR